MDLYRPGFSHSEDPIFSDSRDPIFIYMDPNRVPKSHQKTWRYIIINPLNATDSGAFSKLSLFHGVKRFQQAKPFPDFIHLLSCCVVFSEDNVTAKT